MHEIKKYFVLLLACFAMVACSANQMTGSWSSPDFKGPVKKIYIVGIAKSEMNRRIFEDTFSNQLFSQRVSSESSYRDITTSAEVNKEILATKMAAKGCDSVLLTRLIGQRKESVTTPSRVSGYASGPYYGGYGGYNRPAHYSSWGNYYGRNYNVVYEPSTTTEFIVLTVESVMYDLQTEQLIWSAQFETAVEGTIDAMMQDYVNQVSKDLKKKGLI